jgi:hypothetical protein
MPISPMTFQPLSFQQANPFLTGFGASQDIFAKALQNIVAPQQAQQEIEKQKLANALQQINLQTAPQMNQAELALKQAQLPYMQAQTGRLQQEMQFYPKDIQSQIAARQAQTGLTQEETKYMPLKYGIEASNALRQNERFGQMYELSRALTNMPAAARDAWIAQHPDEYTDMINTIANSKQGQQQSQQMLSNILGQYFPGAQFQQQPQQQMQVSSAVPAPGSVGKLSQAIQQQALQSGGQFTSTPEQIDQIRLASQMSANNAITTRQGRTQAESAVKLDNWLHDVQPAYSSAIQNISQYAGLLGKGKRGVDALQKENPQAYNDYQWFKNTFRTNIDAMITQMEGTSITPAQQEQYQKMVSKAFDDLTTDPKSAIQQFNRLMSTLDDISKQRVSVAEPLFKGTHQEAFGYQGIPAPYVGTKTSGLDMSHMSDDELRKIAGGK